MPYKQTILFTLLAIVALSTDLHTQGNDDIGTLYFPPKLVVAVQTGTMFWNYSSNSEEEAPPLQELTLTRRYDIMEAPLLPMVFFDFGSSAIPWRYHQFYSASATSKYVDTGVGWFWSPVTKYRDILNVLGYRMNQHPSTFVELQGSWSFEPGESVALARERSEVIRDYLVNIWKVDPGRVRLIDPRQRCREGENVFLQEESQAVAISPSSWELIRPVSFIDVNQWYAFFDFNIVVDPNDNPAQVAAIEILARCEDSLVGRMEIVGSPDSTLYRIKGAWEHSLWFTKKDRTALELEAVVWRHDGTTRRSAPIRFPVIIQSDTSDNRTTYGMQTYEGRRFTLPFFSSNQITLSPVQKLLMRERLAQVIVDTLEPGYKYNIVVTGERDVSDAPTLHDGLIRSHRVAYWNALTSYDSFFDEYFQGVLRPIRPVLPVEPQESENSPKDYDEQLRKWYTNFYGARVDDFMRRREEYDSANIITIDIEEGRYLDTLRASRESDAANILQDIFQGQLNDTVKRCYARSLYPPPIPPEDEDEIDAEEYESGDRITYSSDEVAWQADADWGEPVQTSFEFMYTPEERFYARAVTVQIDKEYTPTPEQLLAEEEERKRLYLVWLKDATRYTGEDWEDIDAFIVYLEKQYYGEEEEYSESDSEEYEEEEE
ncbi:MAG: hypothetical protein AB7H80_12640 [Candidatus Kapaibacterium sp.]